MNENKIWAWKRTQYYFLPEKCKTKSPWDYTPTKMTKIKNTDNIRCWLIKIFSNWISQKLLVEVYNCSNTLEIGLAISHKVKHTYIPWPDNYTQVFTQKKWYAHKSLYKNVHSNFSHKSYNIKTIRMPISR